MKITFEKLGGGSGEGAVPPPQDNDTCISTKTQTFYPHGKCRMNVNNTIFPWQ